MEKQMSDTPQTDARAAENDAPEKDAEVTPFTQILQKHRKGGMHEDLSNAIAEVSAAAIETQKKGSVTVKIKIAPNKDGISIAFGDEISKAVPEHDKDLSFFWPNKAGGLQTRHPNQPELPLREVKVNTETGEVID